MRRRIAEATAVVCAQKGYPEATVREIAARAGVAPEVMREIFSSKEEALLGLLSIADEELLGRVESACEKAGDDTAARIERGLRSVLEWVDENPRLARACIVEPTRATKRVFERREQTLERLALLLRSSVSPRPEAVPELLEEFLVAGVCEVLGDRLSGGTGARALDLAPELTQLLLASYPAGPAA